MMQGVGDVAIPCAIMRGGTSKGLFFLDSDLPSDLKDRTEYLLRAFGSPDVRQIDGLGGADPLTSKAAIIRKSELPGVDIDYTFGQVSVSEAFVDFSANCGNISSAVGPYAIMKGFVQPVEPLTVVSIFNTNTKKMIISEVPVRKGAVETRGEFRINGVPGTGAEIKLHFMDPGGSLTGRLLPTGNVADKFVLEDGRKIEVSLVDAGNVTGFVRAEQVGLRGDELPAKLESNAHVLDVLEELRAKISERLGLSENWRQAFKRYRSIPKIAFVSASASYQTLQGERVEGESVDLVARVMAMGKVHKAYAITAAVPTAAAAKIPGSVVHSVSRQISSTVRIGHPSGIMSVGVEMSVEHGRACLKEVVVGRTARLLMEGRVFLQNGVHQG